MEHITDEQWNDEFNELNNKSIDTLFKTISNSKLIEEFYNCNQTEKLCKHVVSKCGLMLIFIKNQTEEICKFAVQRNIYALQYVKEQTDELCKLAVQKHSKAL